MISWCFRIVIVKEVVVMKLIGDLRYEWLLLSVCKFLRQNIGENVCQEKVSESMDLAGAYTLASLFELQV